MRCHKVVEVCVKRDREHWQLGKWYCNTYATKKSVIGIRVVAKSAESEDPVFTSTYVGYSMDRSFKTADFKRKHRFALTIAPWAHLDHHLLTLSFKGIVSRDFVVCFLVSIDRSDISTHQEWVLLLLKVRFHVEFFDIRVWA
jgi:hypothetical protein